MLHLSNYPSSLFCCQKCLNDTKHQQKKYIIPSLVFYVAYYLYSCIISKGSHEKLKDQNITSDTLIRSEN